MHVWPGDDEFEMRLTSSIAGGDGVNVSNASLSLHTGTHVDAPRHYFDAARGVDRIPLNALCGPCVVVAKSGEGHVDGDDVNQLPAGVERVLFKTANGAASQRESPTFDQAFVALTEAAADRLIERGVVLVGVDGPSVEPFEQAEDEARVHRALLRAGVVVVEGLDLRSAEPGNYTLACLPLKIADAVGSPARAILLPP